MRNMLSEEELDDLLSLASTTRPVSRAALDDESVSGALDGVWRRAESNAARRLPARSALRPAYRRRIAAMAGAAVVVGVASLVGVETLTGGTGGAGLPLAVSPAAAAQLNAVAHAAAMQATPGAGAWEYTEEKIENYQDTPIGSTSIRWSYADTVQEWDGPEPGGDVRQRTTADGVTFATSQDAASYAANKSAFDSNFLQPQSFPADDPTGTGVVSDILTPHAWEQQQPASVWGTSSPPTDPQTLLADLAYVRGTLPSERQENKWGGLMHIMSDSTNPQLRATAYRALEYMPDTTVLGTETDQIGRTGVAVEFTGYPGDTDTIIVSPTTGNLLENIVALASASRGLPAGTVVQTEIDLQRGVVSSATALPGGGSQPLPTSEGTLDAATATGTNTNTTASAETTTTATDTTTTATETTTPAAQG